MTIKGLREIIKECIKEVLHSNDNLVIKLRKNGLSGQLLYLAKLSLYYDDFNKFEKDYQLKNFHGLYWHLTKDPNFKINPQQIPRDASSLSSAGSGETGLMVTTDIGNWRATLGKSRTHAALIDLSNLTPNVDYRYVGRGFGHEIFVFKPEGAKVIRVLPINRAQSVNRDYYKKILPDCTEKLQKLYNIAHNIENGDIIKEALHSEGNYINDYGDDYGEVYSDIQDEWYSGQKHQLWNLVPKKDIILLWATYIKFRRIDENNLQKIWQTVKENIIKIAINTDIWNGNDPEFFSKEEYNDITEKEWKRFSIFISDRSGSKLIRNTGEIGIGGQARYSDSIGYLIKLLEEGYSIKDDDNEKLLLVIDKILNVVHGSGPMAKWFVEGGTDTLNKIRDLDVKGIIFETENNYYLYHITPKRNVPSILKHGLTPKKENNIRFSTTAVFLFDNKTTMEDALMNWLGDKFPENEPLSLITINPTGLNIKPSDKSTGYEVLSYDVIPPQNIVKIEDI
jgi:hypothetical protein